MHHQDAKANDCPQKVRPLAKARRLFAFVFRIVWIQLIRTVVVALLISPVVRVALIRVMIKLIPGMGVSVDMLGHSIASIKDSNLT